MGVLVRFGKQKAFLRRGRWMAADPQLEQRLNELTDRWWAETDRPPRDIPACEMAIAEYAARSLGGKIARRVPPSFPSTLRAYWNMRQLSLEF